jgi:hypothetical protein
MDIWRARLPGSEKGPSNALINPVAGKPRGGDEHQQRGDEIENERAEQGDPERSIA